MPKGILFCKNMCFFGLGLPYLGYLKVEQLVLFSRAAGFCSLRSSKFVGWSEVVADFAEGPPPFPRSFSSPLSWREASSKRHSWTLTLLPSVSCMGFSLQTQGGGGGVEDNSHVSVSHLVFLTQYTQQKDHLKSNKEKKNFFYFLLSDKNTSIYNMK